MIATLPPHAPEPAPDRPHPEKASPPGDDSQRPLLPVWKSDDLLGGVQEVRIAHGDATYTLRLTGTGKLILVK